MYLIYRQHMEARSRELREANLHPAPRPGRSPRRLRPPGEADARGRLRNPLTAAARLAARAR